MIREPLIFEISDPGKTGYTIPKLDVPADPKALEGLPLRTDIPDFPQVSEVEVVRHFTRLSQQNYCVDLGLYPLGSCTMKYNPKVNDKIVTFPGFQDSPSSRPGRHGPGQPRSSPPDGAAALRDYGFRCLHSSAFGRSPGRARRDHAHSGLPRIQGQASQVRPDSGFRPRDQSLKRSLCPATK